MSFKTVSVQDPKIADITDKVHYAVQKGASQNTFQSFPSSSASTSSVSFNVNPPSESTVISREVMVETTIDFEIDITNVPIGQKALSYGDTDSLQAFPFSSLVSNVSASINNTNVSSNLLDTKDMLLKCIAPKHLSKYQDTAPALVDATTKYFADGGSNCELNGFLQSGYDKYLQPRGAFPLKSYLVRHFVGGLEVDDSITSTDPTDSWIVRISVETTEPVMLSPFVYSSPNEGSEQGFYGINQINLVFNIDASMKRFWSSKNTGYTYNFRLNPNTPFRSSLLLNFLTCQPDDCVDARNVIPYLETPRYITPITNTPTIVPGASSTIACQNIQLSKIPDLLLIAARKPVASQNCFDSASFLPITGVSVNFNNQSGLLSSASQKDLYKTSIHNGVHQSWTEWSGKASTFDATSASGAPLVLPTVGSVLALSPAYDLSLGAALANGSTGQFNLQINLSVENNGITALAPEIVVIAVSSGIMTTVAGNSSLNTGLLNKQAVLDSSASKVSRTSFKRLVGGNLGAVIGSIFKGLPIIGDVIKGLGGGVKSAGVMSAGMSKLRVK